MAHIALGVPLEGPQAVDQNVVANQRFKADTSPDKVNLAMGTNVAADGTPWSHAAAYPAALAALVNARGAACGSYTVPDSGLLAAAKAYVCDLLGLPANARSQTVVSWATGGGSGAVNRAMAFIRAQHPREAYSSLVVQTDSWPGYASMAYANDIALEHCALDFSGVPKSGLVIAQTVHNGTGRLLDASVWRRMGELLATQDRGLVVDMPYAGFDFCDRPYQEATERSSAAIGALVESRAPVVVAFGPTKVFNTFAYRPGGAAVVIGRTAEEASAADARMKRSERGSTGFIDVATLALVHAMAENPDGLRRDHAAILVRLAEAIHDWRHHAAGSPLERYFSATFGGLFRIVPVTTGAVERLAARHIHVVDASTKAVPRIRVNTMGLPHGRASAIVTAVAAEAAEA
jgi:aspartate/tyrosine/aromatic aminotransferase